MSMVEEIWNINLECDGAEPENKYVKREMDRDHISYFDLIALIEEYGYKSYDYLYYKRRVRGSMAILVAINYDTDVADMIKEHKKEKTVYLFATREQVTVNKSVSMPAVETNEELPISATKGKKGRKKRLSVTQTNAQYADEAEESQDHVQDMSADDDGRKKRRRTILQHVWDLPEGRKVAVRCNPLGQPIGEEGGLLGQFLGTVARNGGYCPLGINDWRNVMKNGGAETILQFVRTKFLYPYSCEKWILKSIGRDWRRYKATLKKSLFNPKKKRSALYKLCPEDVDEDQWVALVTDWKSKKGKALSEKNKISRGMRKTSHTAGTKSYARWAEDLRQDDPEKKMPHRAKVFLATHKKRDEVTNEHVVLLENIMDEHPELAENNEGKVAWQGDALQQVLGDEKPGHVHGLGLLPIPKQVYGGTSHHFKDINLVTMDGPSSDVQSHMMEEIKQLKEHSRKQDKVIEELLNERAHCENVNIQEMNHGNFQGQTVQSKRQRVQCDPTSQKNLVDEHDGTHQQRHEAQENPNTDVDLFFSKEKCYDDTNSKEVSHEEGGSSSPPIPIDDLGQQEFDMEGENSRAVQKQKKRKGTSMIQNEVAGNKVSSRGTSKYIGPQIKVGTVVLLKTAKYPNKEVVAYATILSSSPQTEVGGVKIGSEFYKVRVNHIVSENEPLVRPVSGYKILADIGGKGVPIAWPSICVEMING